MFVAQEGGGVLKKASVLLRKRVGSIAVDVNLADYLSILEDRDHDF